jgi:hypothetical protein
MFILLFPFHLFVFILGDASELTQNLNDSMVGYGLLRKTEQIDQTEAVKFVFIKFQGSSIPVMLKARLGTHQGVVTSLLSVCFSLFFFFFFFLFPFFVHELSYVLCSAKKICLALSRYN